MKLPDFISKLRTSNTSLENEKGDDFLKIMSVNPEYFAKLEYTINDKPVDEILKEIQTGWDLLDIKIEETFNNSDIVIIPPKYELWAYIFLCINFAMSGYRVIFGYQSWSEKVINSIKKHLNYLQYQNIKFLPMEDINGDILSSSKVFNLSDSFTKAPKLSSFSTVIVTKESDLDHVVAYILLNAFSFAGIKASNVKRVLIDENIKDVFEEKLQSRIQSLSQTNSTTIRSQKMREEIHQLICEAISDGADIFWGNPNIDALGSFNLVLSNVQKGMRVFQKKFFGPVLCLTYLPINPKSLRDTLKQQPSKGIVVFTQNPRFLELNSLALREYDISIRPSNKMQNIIFEDYPHLELLFEKLYK